MESLKSNDLKKKKKEGKKGKPDKEIDVLPSKIRKSSSFMNEVQTRSRTVLRPIVIHQKSTK